MEVLAQHAIMILQNGRHNPKLTCVETKLLMHKPFFVRKLKAYEVVFKETYLNIPF